VVRFGEFSADPTVVLLKAVGANLTFIVVSNLTFGGEQLAAFSMKMRKDFLAIFTLRINVSLIVLRLRTWQGPGDIFEEGHCPQAKIGADRLSRRPRRIVNSIEGSALSVFLKKRCIELQSPHALFQYDKFVIIKVVRSYDACWP